MNPEQRSQSDADPTALSIEEAQRRIQKRLPALTDTDTVCCSQALGRIVAEDIYSPVSVPGFRASAMDGYAVRSTESTARRLISARSLAGHPGPDYLPEHACQRITTGARVPDDADAVVQQENVELHGDSIEIKQFPASGLNVRPVGSDSAQGTLLIGQGCVLGAAQLALLAAHGVTQISVYRQLVIALFSTGDELTEPGDTPQAGQIYDANRPLLKAMLSQNALKVIDLGIAEDSEAAIEALFERAAGADLVISSGGVSVGEADYIRSVLEKQGKVDLWKVAMKPGRPLTFGFSRPGQVFFGLPGNPVSAAITCLLFVKPAIRHVLNQPALPIPRLHLPLSDRLIKNPGRVEYQRAVMHQNPDGVWMAGTTGMQDSHVLSSLHKANCLIELPVESTGAEAGGQVCVIPFAHFSEPVL